MNSKKQSSQKPDPETGGLCIECPFCGCVAYYVAKNQYECSCCQEVIYKA
ncbi:MAG: hypothetical protein ILA52_01125 [Alphaproteobacteria bacterium]|nr:hypothetical protein [Alphaproteobacteria bacterium]